MKERLLFLAKLILVSSISFYLWKSFAAKPYILFLNRSIYFIRPFFINNDASLRVLNKIPYFYLVFLSLTLATPHTPLLRRVKLILAGTLVFFAFDFLTVFSGLTSVAGSPKYLYLSALYHTIPPILAVALWIVPNLNEVGNLFEKKVSIPKPSLNHKHIRICPICKKERAGMIDHIRSAHGEKSLRSWKVERFLARQGLSKAL